MTPHEIILVTGAIIVFGGLLCMVTYIAFLVVQGALNAQKAVAQSARTGHEPAEIDSD
jgi:hypothetical protein